MNTFKGISNTKFILSGLLLLAFISSGYYQAMPDSGPSLSDSQKAELLIMYAPRVWLSDNHPDHGGEIYFPSPVEFSFQHNARIWEPQDHEDWWLYTYEFMGSPSDVLDYFHGCDGDPCRLADVPVYAFWDEVDNVDIGGISYDVVDLIYFLWFPYNRGKLVYETTYGHHVGDWEHVSIRLIPDPGGGYVPYQIYLPAHNFGYRYYWDAIGKFGTTHPIVYAAWGSHGIWKTADKHVYAWYLTEKVTDYTSAGTAWDTWDFVEAYDFDAQAGLIGNAWPTWMSNDWDNPELGYTDPASGPIKRWGNDAMECIGSGDNRFCQREPGPWGPIDKGVWDVQVLK